MVMDGFSHIVSDPTGNDIIYTYLNENELLPPPNSDNVEQVIQESSSINLETEQEVLLYDETTGQVQKYLYVPPKEEQLLVQPEIQIQPPISTGTHFLSEITEPINIDESSILELSSELEQQQIPEEVNNFIRYEVNNLEEEDDDVLNHIELVECHKCKKHVLSNVFQKHLATKHNNSNTISSNNNHRHCSICKKSLSRKEYLTHFKDKHSDVRLGCPKCPQTYHTPDLLNAHYQHFHMKEDEEEDSDYTILNDGKSALRNVRLLMKCRICDSLVPNIKQHMLRKHDNKRKNTPKLNTPKVIMPCNVCGKSFETQREFTNHRRRKDFCRPPIIEPPKQVRRIGIIRKSLVN